MKRNIVNYIKEYGISLFITKGIRRLYLKSNSVLATKINAYNEDKGLLTSTTNQKGETTSYTYSDKNDLITKVATTNDTGE